MGTIVKMIKSEQMMTNSADPDQEQGSTLPLVRRSVTDNFYGGPVAFEAGWSL